jgi:hypothetical protein
MVLAEIIIRIKAVEDGKEVIKVDPIKAVVVTAMGVVRITISLTVEAQEHPLITKKCVLSCQSQEDASRVQENAHTFTLQMTSPINKLREEVFRAICLKTIWEGILDSQILNKGWFKTSQISPIWEQNQHQTVETFQTAQEVQAADFYMPMAVELNLNS